MKLSREDIVIAAEAAEFWEDDYSIRETYSGRYGVNGAGVVLPSASAVTTFMVALAVQLTENDRADDAMSLARLTRTDSMGTSTIVYWGGVEITD